MRSLKIFLVILLSPRISHAWRNTNPSDSDIDEATKEVLIAALFSMGIALSAWGLIILSMEIMTSMISHILSTL